MSTQLESHVRRIAADVFGVSDDEITLESSPASIVTWDSVAHLSFTLALEQELGVQFELDELEQMTSVGAAVEVAGRRLQQA
jgi:acyl carrier protein